MEKKHPHPAEVVKVMRPQVLNLGSVVRHHFQNRNTTSTRAAVRNWIAAYRNVCIGSGYAACLEQIRARDAASA